jgi:murein L,D-transpeptidase YcbB/YkuD
MMSIRQAFSVVGAAVGTALAGTVGAAGDAAPPADPDVVRELLIEIGMAPATSSPVDLDRALRRFQLRSGLTADGIAGPRTVHALARYAADVRELRDLGLAA